MWDCDAEGSYLVEMPPDDDAVGYLDGVLGGGVQPEGEELDQEVTTPTCNASWSADGEATPLFSSSFPRPPGQSSLWDKRQLIEEPDAVDDASVASRLN
jgi:hypothetical protein